MGSGLELGIDSTIWRNRCRRRFLQAPGPVAGSNPYQVCGVKRADRCVGRGGLRKQRDMFLVYHTAFFSA
jgi:hypothetical protein